MTPKPHISAFTPAEQPIARLILAHGAGAGMDSEFILAMAEKLSQQGVEVWRFNFPYMQISSETGKRRPPNKMPVLLQDMLDNLLAQDTPLPLFLAGKSMGGRAATLLISDPDLREKAQQIKGVVALGYPFHPSGKPEKLRVDHLSQMIKPCLVIQGERDALGSRAEIDSYGLPSNLDISYLTDGDHSFKPRKASGVSLAQNYDAAVTQIVQFIRKHS